MVIQNQNDEFYVNNRRFLRFTVVDQDNGGVPFDLTGLVVKWTLSLPGVFDSPLLAKATDTAGVTVVSALNGIVGVNIEPTDTVNFAPSEYYQELEVFGGAGPVIVATGEITLLGNVENP